MAYEKTIEEAQSEEIEHMHELIFEAYALLVSAGCWDDASLGLSLFVQKHDAGRRRNLQAEYRRLKKEVPALREQTVKAHERLAWVEGKLSPDEIKEIEEEF